MQQEGCYISKRVRSSASSLTVVLCTASEHRHALIMFHGVRHGSMRLRQAASPVGFLVIESVVLRVGYDALTLNTAYDGLHERVAKEGVFTGQIHDENVTKRLRGKCNAASYSKLRPLWGTRATQTPGPS